MLNYKSQQGNNKSRRGVSKTRRLAFFRKKQRIEPTPKQQLRGGVTQARGFKTIRQSQKVSSSLMAECPHESHDITYKLLSSQHTRKVNDVIMPFFLTAPRSHGPSRERRRSHIISAWYLTKKLPGPRPGYPRTHLGALDHN
jgi:hypothetical protein